MGNTGENFPRTGGASRDTIFALASGAGRAGVAVLRLSGSAAGEVLCRLSGRSDLPPARRATLTALRDPQDDSLIDRALALWFPAPASFTGEDVVELQIHGGRAVIGDLVEVLARLPGLRPAEPGEYSRRAFENGKLDLTAAEGLIDLVNAETSAQRRQALRQLDGRLGELYENWRSRLIRALARLEAAIDFPDEDLPETAAAEARMQLTALLSDIEGHLDDGHRGERLREGFSVAILGAPNVGKSSLLNALARRDVAIVSSIAGTTRDVVEVTLDLAGFPVTLADTAGLRETTDEIEREGVRRALSRAAKADLKLILTETTSWPEMAPSIRQIADLQSLLVLTKADLAAQVPDHDGPLYAVSTTTGAGIAALLSALTDVVRSKFDFGSTPSLTRARHRSALEDCVKALRRALTAREPELEAEDIRLAARSLGRITGIIDVEDILDVVFREFCIGK